MDKSLIKKSKFVCFIVNFVVLHYYLHIKRLWKTMCITLLITVFITCTGYQHVHTKGLGLWPSWGYQHGYYRVFSKISTDF